MSIFSSSRLVGTLLAAPSPSAHLCTALNTSRPCSKWCSDCHPQEGIPTCSCRSDTSQICFRLFTHKARCMSNHDSQDGSKTLCPGWLNTVTSPAATGTLTFLGSSIYLSYLSTTLLDSSAMTSAAELSHGLMLCPQTARMERRVCGNCSLLISLKVAHPVLEWQWHVDACTEHPWLQSSSCHHVLRKGVAE